jgi:hypothetical protein
MKEEVEDARSEARIAQQQAQSGGGGMFGNEVSQNRVETV